MPFDEEYQKNIEMQSSQARIGNELAQQQQQAKIMEEREMGLVKEQLDLSEEIEKIDHLLRGHIQKRDGEGELYWEEPKSNEDVLLAEQGINLVLDAIQWYLQKNTLLSNYDEKIINQKMEDFATSLADALFMNYEKYFLYPTAEECQNKLLERLKKKQQDMIYSAELLGVEYNKEELWNKLISEIDSSKERIKIREQLVKDKLKGFDLLMRKIQDAVHSTYQRAWNGQERKTLRQHWHITENMGQNNQPLKKSNVSGWFRKT